MSRMCAYCGVGEASTMAVPCVSTAGHWFIHTPSVSVVTQCQLCQRGEPCGENLKLTLEAENALLKKKLAIAMQGLDDIEYKDSGFPCACGGIASGIKAEIEEVK